MTEVTVQEPVPGPTSFGEAKVGDVVSFPRRPDPRIFMKIDQNSAVILNDPVQQGRVKDGIDPTAEVTIYRSMEIKVYM